ncbi:MAG: DUF368 domain-containing protein [Methanomassiliicoccaceae archaeon]|nr:DUF368 domain-containing protein [Methanomassiliicoccaceae archaeon]
MGAREGSNNFIVGFLVGAVSWLPGISGGIVAVVFGVYERLIDDVNNLRTKIKEDFWFLFTLGSGIILGMLVMVFIIDYLMGAYLLATMFLFVGLIIGQLPSLTKITKRGEPTKGSHVVWFSLGIVAMMLLLLLKLNLGDGDGGDTIEHSGLFVGIALSFFAGAVFAVSKIVPGISGSTVLLALGLFTWINHLIASFDLLYLLPFGIGFIVAVFMFARIMGHILKNYHHPVYYFITGLTVGSIILIIAITEIVGFNDMLIGCAAAAAGVVMSLGISMIRRPDSKEKCA